MEKVLYFSPDFETTYQYNSNTNYNQVIKEYNTLVKEGQREKIKRLLDKHGGIIALVMKREYQMQQTKKQANK